VAVGDHGESLGEHHEQTHALFIYEATQRVPLIIRPPGGDQPKGRPVKAVVSQIDIMPTVLDYLDVPPPAGAEIQGESLRPFMAPGPEPPTERLAYLESKFVLLHYNWAPLSALSGPRYKYIKSPKPELYDLINDRNETQNLLEGLVLGPDGAIRAAVRDGDSQAAGSDPLARLSAEARKALMLQKAELDRLEAKWSKEKLESQDVEDLSPEMRAQLEALGYIVGGFQGNPELAATKDPKDYADLLPVLQALRRALDNDEFQNTIQFSDKVLERDPENPMALQSKASALFGIGEFEAALEAYQKFFDIHIPQGTPEGYFEIGGIHLRMSSQKDIDPALKKECLENAKRAFEKGIELKSQNPVAHYYIGRVLMMLGDFGTALAHFNDKSLVNTEHGYVGMAVYYADKRNPRRNQGLAESYFEKAGELIDDRSVVYWQERAQYLFYQKKDYPKVIEFLEKSLEEDQSLKEEPMLMEVLEKARKQVEGEKGEGE